MTDKVCRNCGEEKPLAEFYRHRQMLDGHLNVCRECVRARVRLHRRQNDSVREYDRQRAKTPKRRKAGAERLKAYRAANPEANRAHQSVSYALRIGTLKKEPCVFCSAGKNLHAHHRDYARPLDVTWVCAKCHHRMHALTAHAHGPTA